MKHRHHLTAPYLIVVLACALCAGLMSTPQGEPERDTASLANVNWTMAALSADTSTTVKR